MRVGEGARGDNEGRGKGEAREGGREGRKV